MKKNNQNFTDNGTLHSAMIVNINNKISVNLHVDIAGHHEMLSFSVDNILTIMNIFNVDFWYKLDELNVERYCRAEIKNGKIIRIEHIGNDKIFLDI